MRKESFGRIYPMTQRDILVDRAQSSVAQAVKIGKIPHCSTLECVDCGLPAQCYDHRDYNKPLDVVPVCKGCNNRRGPGFPFPSEIDRASTKHGLGHNAGVRWNSLEGGEGFAPLEAKLADGFTTVDIDSWVENDAERIRARSRAAFDDNLRRVTSTVFSTGLQGGVRNVKGIARAEYFKRRDPWYA